MKTALSDGFLFEAEQGLFFRFFLEKRFFLFAQRVFHFCLCEASGKTERSADSESEEEKTHRRSGQGYFNVVGVQSAPDFLCFIFDDSAIEFGEFFHNEIPNLSIDFYMFYF